MVPKRCMWHYLTKILRFHQKHFLGPPLPPALCIFWHIKKLSFGSKRCISEGFREMSEGDFADMCGENFLVMSMVGQANVSSVGWIREDPCELLISSIEALNPQLSILYLIQRGATLLWILLGTLPYALVQSDHAFYFYSALWMCRERTWSRVA